MGVSAFRFPFETVGTFFSVGNAGECYDFVTQVLYGLFLIWGKAESAEDGKRGARMIMTGSGCPVCRLVCLRSRELQIGRRSRDERCAGSMGLARNIARGVFDFGLEFKWV